jgi:predicted nucleic acid-binding Zn finger protein
MSPFLKPSRKALCLIAFALSMMSLNVFTPVSFAEKYQSRLSSLLLKKNDLYMPTRLVLGQEARFVVKAPAGDVVKVFISTKNEGYILPNGTPLRVGTESQELTGTIPDNGVLELKMAVPKDESMEGKVVYIDAAVGPTNEELAPIDLIDAAGRRTDENTLVVVKPAEAGGPNIMPSMPGLSPQVLNQLTTMSDAYTKGDSSKKQLLDNGDINRDRALDQNPFINRGLQPGVGAH